MGRGEGEGLMICKYLSSICVLSGFEPTLVLLSARSGVCLLIRSAIRAAVRVERFLVILSFFVIKQLLNGLLLRLMSLHYLCCNKE